jgi:hypothetical protein
MRPEARKVGGKVQKVMHEFGSGKLRSSSGQKVTNPKQAIAIALSEQRRAKKYKEGGDVVATNKQMDDLARRAREEAARMKSPTPTSADKAKMQQQADEAKRQAAEDAAYERSKRPFARGGAIAKQDTQHGRMDMPFKKLSKFAGMKHGGKVKRYADGGDVEGLDDMTFNEAFKTARDEAGAGKTFTWRGKKYTTNYASETLAKKTTDYGDESARMAARAPAPKAEAKPTPSGTTDAGAVTGRASPLASKARSLAEKEETAERLPGAVARGALEAAGTIGGLGALSKLARAKELPLYEVKQLTGPKEMKRLTGPEEMKRLTGPKEMKRLTGPKEMKRLTGPKTSDAATQEQRNRMFEADLARAMERGEVNYRKGGNVESKKMMAKEVAFMKKKGAPKSMLKHEEAEMKGYARGGKIKEVMGPRTMSQDVEGGYKAHKLAHGEHSEQKRGHTRGTVVKMASGGSVRAHGEHSIQKSGHTKGRMV